jgi:hypothetical protein
VGIAGRWKSWFTGCGLGAADGVFAGLTAASLLPLLLTRYPESADYLNHMARQFVLTAPAGHPVHRYYVAHWHLAANLGIETIVMPLGLFMPLEAAMKIVWTMCVLGLAGGAWFLHRALFGRTQATLPLAAIMLFNMPMALGLLNYTLGIGLALFAAGYWLRGERMMPSRLGWFNLLAALTLLCHVAAAGALALTIAALLPLKGWKIEPRRALEAAAGFVLPALLFIAMSLSQPAATGGGNPMGGIGYSFVAKEWLFIIPFYTGINAADVSGWAFWCAGLIAAILVGRFGFHKRMILPLIVWLVALMAVPNMIRNATYIDQRLTLMPAFMLTAAFSFAPAKRLWRLAPAALAAAGVLLRLALLLPEWRAHSREVENFRIAAATLPEGVKVLTTAAADYDRADCGRTSRWQPFYEHVPALLTIDRAAFVSTVFADRSMQQIAPTPAVVGYARPNAGIMPWRVLARADAAMHDRAVARALPKSFWSYAPNGWRERYDYLVEVRGNCATGIPPQRYLVPAAASGPFHIYRIAH